ncbi:flavin reductase [Thalassospira marina]|uniref:Flavin reductase n=1 Tax=Thalassospira marina TaxID=2048283 RepID=A0A2N3KTU6_9PROT|nr:flavin reductase family protein [Thalassospira marina]AUG55688.1 flavin reductase [Thalassospira marina]PKR53916.1 flavin reductase [Thalassospira marina]
MANATARADSAIDGKMLRNAFGTFVTGITVVTTLDADGSPRGMTANSFTSVSLDPPLLLVCISKSASSHPVFTSAGRFAVNILHEDQTDISNVFASRAEDKFQSVTYSTMHTGAPVLSDCLSWFDCSTFSQADAGDHTILIGQVRAFGTTPVAPLGFCRGKYVSVKDPLPAGWLEPNGMLIGYLIEAGDRLLMRSDGKGGWVLPTAKRLRTDRQLELAGDSALSLIPENTFLYSVFDVADNDPGHLVYRARLAGDWSESTLPGDMKLFPVNDLPFDQIPTHELRSTLRRYVRERQSNQFGIYMDSGDGGRVAMIEGDLQA